MRLMQIYRHATEKIMKWNQFVIDDDIKHVNRVIYSKYYRDIYDITDQNILDGENDPSTLNSKGDLRGTKVYNLVTHKKKKIFARKWLINFNREYLKTKCRKYASTVHCASACKCPCKKLCEFQPT